MSDKRRTYKVRVYHSGFPPRTEEIVADTWTMGANIISFYLEREVTDLNPFPESDLVKMFSLYNLESVTPVYEEEE